jgi:hypothetical protein
MSDRLLERCSIELEHFITKLHRNVEHCEVATASIPIAPYEVQYTKETISNPISLARDAYNARAMFATEWPDWGPLPLGQECTPLLQAKGAMHLLGCYAFSLELMCYDYLGHPSFYRYGCGMMAHPDAPEHVRDDIDLRVEFPARELPGLGRRMIWFYKHLSMPERLRALGRHMNA